MAKEIECDVCDETILESEARFKVTLADAEGIVLRHETICECCKDEVQKALGHGGMPL